MSVAFVWYQRANHFCDNILTHSLYVRPLPRLLQGEARAAAAAAQNTSVAEKAAPAALVASTQVAVSNAQRTRDKSAAAAAAIAATAAAAAANLAADVAAAKRASVRTSYGVTCAPPRRCLFFSYVILLCAFRFAFCVRAGRRGVFDKW